MNEMRNNWICNNMYPINKKDIYRGSLNIPLVLTTTTTL